MEDRWKFHTTPSISEALRYASGSLGYQFVLFERAFYSAAGMPAIARQFERVSGIFAVLTAIFALLARRAGAPGMRANVFTTLIFHDCLPAPSVGLSGTLRHIARPLPTWSEPAMLACCF